MFDALLSISLQVEVHHARSILEVFDAISYKKGSAVIRMLMDYLGDDVFQVGTPVVLKMSEHISW